jgi:hypothetical protein
MVKTCNRSVFQKTALTFCMAIVLYFSSAGQTGQVGTGKQIQQSFTYDTVLAGNGYANYKLSFSQWNPRLGKLLAVRIRALVKVQYGFILRNTGDQPDSFDVRVGHQDTISSAAMANPYGNITSHGIGAFLLDSVTGKSQMPYYLLDNYNNTDSISDQLEKFVGTGNILMNFSSVTWSKVISKNNSGYYYNATIRDTTRFSVTYIYAGEEIQPGASLIRFTATPVSIGTIQVDWTIARETMGRQYEIQSGRNEQQFEAYNSPVNSIPDIAEAVYQRNLNLPSGISGKLYFRLKMTDSMGAITYSEPREIFIDGKLNGLDNAGGRELMLYPNPAKEFIHLTFNDPLAGDWQVDILTSDGRLVQRNSFFNTNMALLNFNRKFSAGLYFAIATDSRTSRRYVGTFVIQ